MHRRCCWPPERPVPGSCRRSLTSFQQPGALQAAASTISSSSASLLRQAVDARPVGDVVVDRLRERIRLLEHHADPRAQLHDVDVAVVDVLAVEQDLARRRGSSSIVSFMRFRQRRKVDLAAAGRADQRGHLVAADVEADIAERLLVAVEDVDVGAAHARVLAHSPPRPRSRATSRSAIAAGAAPRLRRLPSWLDCMLTAGFPCASHVARRHAASHAHQRRSKRWRRMTASRFMQIRKASSTMIAADGALDEGALRAVGPEVDLHRQHGRRVERCRSGRRR